MGFNTWPVTGDVLRVIDDRTALWWLNSTQSSAGAPLDASGNLTFLVAHADTLPTPLTPLTIAVQPNATNRTSTPPPAIDRPSILSVTGCAEQSGSTTLGCVLGTSQLTISGVAFRTGQLASVGGQWCPIMRAVTNSTIVCSLRNQQSPLLLEALLPVTIIDLSSAQLSNTLMAVQFAQLVPAITAVSGCGGESGSSDCDPALDVLTISGSGFSAPLSLCFLDADYGQLVTVPLTRAQLVNGTLVQPLSSLPRFALGGMSAFNDAPFGVWLVAGYVQSNVVSLAFRALPLNVTSLTGCDESSGPLQTRNCFSTDSLVLYGDNLYAPVSIAIADGGSCEVSTAGYGSVQCRLQMVAGAYDVDTPYDVVVNSGAAGRNVTLRAALTFTSAPTITALTSTFCPPDPAVITSSSCSCYSSIASPSLPTALRCAAGDVLTLLGARFVSSPSLTVMLSMAGGGVNGRTVPALCGNVSVLSNSAMTCVLPSAADSWNPSPVVTVQLQANGSQSSNVVPAVLFRSSWQPAVEAVSGCAGQDGSTAGRSAVGCLVGSTITVNGSSFLASMAVQLWDGELGELYSCVGVSVLSPSQLTCQLPVLVLVSAVLLPLFAVALTLAIAAGCYLHTKQRRKEEGCYDGHYSSSSSSSSSEVQLG